MNILCVISHNSTEEVIKLVSESIFQPIHISEVLVLSNGHEVSSEEQFELTLIAERKKLNIHFYNTENKGYGNAVNYAVSLALTLIGNACEYVFISNPDLVLKEHENRFPYNNYDIVGFPLFEGDKFIISHLTAFTPFIPNSLRKKFKFRPHYGKAKIIHGGFFGLKVSFLRSFNFQFYEDYFLYWEEVKTFYELNQVGINPHVSDTIIVNHDGEKSITSLNGRYYLLRNGIAFYSNTVRSKLLSNLWKVLSFLMLLKFVIYNKENFTINLIWYKQAILDYKQGYSGPRRK